MDRGCLRCARWIRAPRHAGLAGSCPRGASSPCTGRGGGRGVVSGVARGRQPGLLCWCWCAPVRRWHGCAAPRRAALRGQPGVRGAACAVEGRPRGGSMTVESVVRRVLVGQRQSRRAMLLGGVQIHAARHAGGGAAGPPPGHAAGVMGARQWHGGCQGGRPRRLGRRCAAAGRPLHSAPGAAVGGSSGGRACHQGRCHWHIAGRPQGLRRARGCRCRHCVVRTRTRPRQALGCGAPAAGPWALRQAGEGVVVRVGVGEARATATSRSACCHARAAARPGPPAG